MTTAQTLEEVFDQLRAKQQPNCFYLSRHKLSDEQATEIANTLKESPTVDSVIIKNCEISDEGSTALAGAFAAMPQLTELSLADNKISDEGYRLIDAAISPEVHKNLCSGVQDDIRIITGNSISRLCSENAVAGDRLYKMLKGDFKEECTPDDWTKIYERLPLLYIMGETYESYTTYEDHKPVVDAFRDFVESLPAFDVSPDTKWESLLEKQGEHAPIDNPIVCKKLPEIVAEMNEAGRFARSAELLQEDGSPSQLLEAFIKLDDVASLFTHENWIGAPKGELQKVLNALPEEEAEKIPNRHALAASLRAPQVAAKVK